MTRRLTSIENKTADLEVLLAKSQSQHDGDEQRETDSLPPRNVTLANFEENSSPFSAIVLSRAFCRTVSFCECSLGDKLLVLSIDHEGLSFHNTTGEFLMQPTDHPTLRKSGK